MRFFEILFLFAVLTGLVFNPPWPHAQLTVAVNVLALAALLWLLHAVIEGVHWQLGPGYLALILLGVAIFLRAEDSRAAASSIAAFGVFCVLASLLLSFALPMFRFEPTTGAYKTGTSILCLADASREDASPSGKRELMVQLWYPAKPSRHPRAAYRRAQETTRVSSYQSVLKTSSRLDAPLAISETRFPVLLFNPAWNGRRTQNTFLLEELASHGFVVAAIDHTYNSEPVAFPDGRVVTAQHVRAMEDVSTSTAEEVQLIGNNEVERQALDDRFVLDQLAAWNQQQGSRWYQKLDTDRAGALGHSLGGATAVEGWATDERIRAAMNMDGWTFGKQAITGRRKPESDADRPARPLLFIYEGNYEPFPDAVAAQASGKSQVELQVHAWDAANVRELLRHHGGYWLKLQGAEHMNFTDRTISSPFRRLAGGGPIDGRLAHRILRDYAVNFFKHELLGKPSALLAGSVSPYPEVTVRSIPSAAEAPAGI